MEEGGRLEPELWKLPDPRGLLVPEVPIGYLFGAVTFPLIINFPATFTDWLTVLVLVSVNLNTKQIFTIYIHFIIKIIYSHTHPKNYKIMPKLIKKGTKGTAAQYITRSQAIRKLQLSLTDFRYLEYIYIYIYIESYAF